MIKLSALSEKHPPNGVIFAKFGNSSFVENETNIMASKHWAIFVKERHATFRKEKFVLNFLFFWKSFSDFLSRLSQISRACYFMIFHLTDHFFVVGWSSWPYSFSAPFSFSKWRLIIPDFFVYRQDSWQPCRMWLKRLWDQQEGYSWTGS